MTPQHTTDEQCRAALRSVGGDAAVALEYHGPDGWTCPVCDVYHGDPCPCCDGRGFHRLDCFEVLDAGKPIGD